MLCWDRSGVGTKGALKERHAQRLRGKGTAMLLGETQVLTDDRQPEGHEPRVGKAAEASRGQTTQGFRKNLKGSFWIPRAMGSHKEFKQGGGN